MCKQSICNSSELHIDILRTIDDHIDKLEQSSVV
jgi:hypothetical protein